jgi:hypothetical protein
MTDTPTPPAPDAPAPARRWWQSRTNQAGIALLLFLAWSIAANSWTDKGCDAFPQSYSLVVTHFGTPDHYQGCDEYGDYTDDYAG